MLGTNLLSRFLNAINVSLIAAIAFGILTLRSRVNDASDARNVVTLRLFRLIALNLPMITLRLVSSVGQLLGPDLAFVKCSRLLVSVVELRPVMVKTTLWSMSWVRSPSCLATFRLTSMTRLLETTTPLGRGLVRKKLLLSIRAVQPLISPALTLPRLHLVLTSRLAREMVTFLMQLTMIMRLAYRLTHGPG